jgi:hypothetical protein
VDAQGERFFSFYMGLTKPMSMLGLSNHTSIHSFLMGSLQHWKCSKRWSYLQEKNEFIFLLDGAEVKDIVESDDCSIDTSPPCRN